jgi:hypothetical protein
VSDPAPLPPAAQPRYLTEALRACGVLGTGCVTEVAIESSQGTILSRIIRLRLSYDGNVGDAPRSLILKTSLPERAETMFEGGRHEVAFYSQVAASTPEGLLPRCFDAHCDTDTRVWHLLLEDLTETHVVSGNWPLPPSLAESRKIVAARARFHAAWWDDPRLGASIGGWLDSDDPQLARFAEVFEQFAEKHGEQLSPERGDLYRRLIDAGRRLNARYHTHRDMTLIQGDSHVWNAFLPRDPASEDVRFFDWDCWRIDVATDDLAYMMALQWFPDQRRRWERPLLDHYHEALVANGVRGYDRRALDHDYRLSALWQVATPVWQAMLDIPRYVWCFNLERIFMAVDDLGCRDLLV